jgi:hypothetical protein
MSKYTSNGHRTRLADLQASKRAAAERFEAIASRHLPPGYSVVRYRKNLSGYCDHKNKVIVSPRPRTRKALYIFLHECAHAHLHRNGNRGRVPRHVEELEAEQWAHARMREAGIRVPRAMTKRAKRYVARKIKQAIARGAKHIDPQARRYVRISGSNGQSRPLAAE